MRNSTSRPLSLNQLNGLLQQAKIVDGSYPLAALVWMPRGYKVLSRVEDFLNGLFERYGYERYVFPFLVSSQEFDRINRNISSFEKGVFKVSESVTLRPSGESAIYPMFRRWIKSERDLPLRVFQIGSMFRKGSTRGFMRPNENDFFVEAHAAFGSREDADLEFARSNRLVEEFLRWLAIPTLKTIRPPWTNKPVAEREHAFDALLPIGETSLLNVTYAQMQIFSKAFGVSFAREDGTREHTYQTEFGFSQRAILTSIWLLSDQDGLFLLPSYAPTQAVVIQIDPENSELGEYVERVFATLGSNGIRATVDREQRRLSKRFSKYEGMGIPVRLEIGENELRSSTVRIVRHDTKHSRVCPVADLAASMTATFAEIVSDSYLENERRLLAGIVACDEKGRIRETIESGRIAKIRACFSEKCVTELQREIALGEVIGFEPDEGTESAPCAHCLAPTLRIAYYARRV